MFHEKGKTSFRINQQRCSVFLFLLYTLSHRYECFTLMMFHFIKEGLLCLDTKYRT